MAKPPIEKRVKPIDDTSTVGRESQFLNRLVWLTAATVFPLIWAGGLVTTTKAGMAVPDWPGTYGYNMFLYPWTTWFFGPWDLFIEHGHRLLGSLAGIWCLLLVGATWVRPTPKSVRILALGGLALVVLQGIMGGVRVLNVDREIARIHGCLGPAFFAYLLGLSVVTSRWWKAVAIPMFWTNGSGLTGGETAGFHSQAEIVRAGRLVLSRLKAQRFLTMVVLGLAYGQLVLGASMRHISEAAEPSYFRAIVWFHVTGAICTAGAAIALWVAARCPTPGLSMPRWILVGLVGLQICLGLGTWVMKYNFPDWFAGYSFAQAHRIVNDDFYQVQIVTAHVAVGSLILGVAALLLTRLWRAEFCLQSIVAKFPLEVQRETSSDRSTVQVASGIAVGSEKLTPC
jgi:cytochrome c oxidase assembly protein subunit 15